MDLDLRRLANARKARGLSQSEIAHRARTSLATIQNIEAGNANPALATVERIFKVLGLRLELRSAPLDWDRLASLGVPILAGGQVSIRPDKDMLKQELFNLSPDALNAITDPREKSA